MRHIIERTGVLLVLVLTSMWPIVLAGVIAGQKGVQAGLIAYLAAGGFLFLVLVLGGIRGILE